MQLTQQRSNPIWVGVRNCSDLDSRNIFETNKDPQAWACRELRPETGHTNHDNNSHSSAGFYGQNLPEHNLPHRFNTLCSQTAANPPERRAGESAGLPPAKAKPLVISGVEGWASGLGRGLVCLVGLEDS